MLVPKGPVDYASKHWSGLVRDYYAERVRRLTKAVGAEAAAGRPWTSEKDAAPKAALAYEWTTATNAYPTSPVGDAFAVSQAMHAKYAPRFASAPRANVHEGRDPKRVIVVCKNSFKFHLYTVAYAGTPKKVYCRVPVPGTRKVLFCVLFYERTKTRTRPPRAPSH